MWKQRLKWFAFNAVFIGMFYAAVWEGVQGAENVIVAWTWFMLFVSAALCMDKIREVIAAKGSELGSVPQSVDTAFDLAVASTMFWFGWWWVGTAYLLHWLLLLATKEKVKELIATAKAEVDKEVEAHE